MTGLDVMFAAPFMQLAALALVLLAVASAVVGVMLNLRELEFVSDGLVHAVFPGVVAGFMIGGSTSTAIYLWALVAALAATVLLTYATHRGVGTDATTAVLLAGAFAIGIVLVSRGTNYATGIEQLLFGQLLTTSWNDIWLITLFGGAAVAMVAATWKQQLVIAVDRTAAAAAGYAVLRNQLILNVAIALVVVAASRAVGNLLVLALLIVPAAIGRLLSYRMHRILLLAGCSALLSSMAGLIVGYWLSVDARINVSPAAVLVLVLVLVYLLVAGCSQLVRALRARERVVRA